MSAGTVERAPAASEPWLAITLASVVRVEEDALAGRVQRWRLGLRRIGLDVEATVVRDVGALLAFPSSMRAIGFHPRAQALVERSAADRAAQIAVNAARSDPLTPLVDYRHALADLAVDPTVLQLAALRLADGVLVALLANLLGVLPRGAGADRSGRRAGGDDPTTLATWRAEVIAQRLAELDDARARALLVGRHDRFLEGLTRLRLQLDLLDVDTVRLLATAQRAWDPASGLPATEGALAGVSGVDMIAALGSTTASDIVRFSLELLPGLAEGRTARAASTAPTGGLEGLATRGSIDALVPSELAWDDDELARRAVDGELLYYARERTAEKTERLHFILVDASASMRGDRATFARGLAIVLARQLERRGDEVQLRFFDRRLYEPIARGRGAAARAIPALLAFRGENGRNPERALTQLLDELDVTCAQRRRAPSVHVLTHGAFQVSRATIRALSQRAPVHAVLISSLRAGDGTATEGVTDTAGVSAPRFDGAELFARIWTVDAQMLKRGKTRAAEARRVIDGVAENRRQGIDARAVRR